MANNRRACVWTHVMNNMKKENLIKFSIRYIGYILPWHNTEKVILISDPK